VNHVRSHLLLCSASLIALSLLVVTTDSAEKPKKPMRETVTLPVDKNALKRFGAIEDYLAEKRWSEAIDLLQEISQTDGRHLVLAQPGTTGESAVYLNVATRCNILLSQLPPEGLATYRKKIDPQAKRWLDHWKQTRDEADLQRLVREAYLSSLGDEALWALGEAAWDRGDLASARLYWTQLVPLGQEAREANLPTVLRYPDSDLDQAAILARLVLCTLLEGERNRAGIEIERFRERFPDATGTLAGRHGRFVDLLKQIYEESAPWNLISEEVATFGLNNGRSGTLPASVEIGASKWSRPLPTNRSTSATDRGPLSYHPVTYEDFVFVNNARSIWAWNLLTGEPAWASDRGTAEIYPPAPDDITGLPQQKGNIGVPHYTMTIADGRLYARMGSAITNVAEGEGTVDSELVCLDVANGQGKLVWKVAAHELIKEEHTWRFEGSPLILAGRAYVVLSRRPQLEFAIACLEASSGALLWHRPVVFARGNVEEHQNRVSHLLLTAGAGKLFLSTDAGAIIAVNAKDGRLDWAVSYESVVIDKAPLQTKSLQGLVPAMFHEGFVFVAPNDCSRLFCIEADSGRVRWQLKQPEPARERWRHLLGVVPGGDAGRLIVSGTTLSSIDIATKRIVFGPRSSGTGNRQSLPETDRGFGRGVIAGKVIMWPTLESIKIVDATTGTTIGNKPLHAAGAAETGGNLAVAQGMLLVAQPERLVVYCEYSLLKRRLEKQISDINADDQSATLLVGSANSDRRQSLAYLYGQLSDLEFAQGDLGGAIAALRDAIGSNEQADQSATSRSKQRLMELLRQASRTAMSEGHVTVAVEHLTEARELAVEPGDVAAILMELAKSELARNRPVAAIEHWQEILDDSRIRDTSTVDSTFGRVAEKAISDLIHDRGRVAFIEIENRAAVEISSLLAAKDLVGLRKTLQKYPQAQATVQAWHDLATMERSAGQLNSALAIQAHLINQAVLPGEQAAVMADRASTLDAGGYWRAAQETWRQLQSNNYATLDIEFEGAKHRVRELAQQRLANPIYRRYDALEQASFRHLERSWVTSLVSANHDAAADVLVPQGQAPSLELASIIVRSREAADSRWDCVERATGRVRWSRSWTIAPQWSAYGDSDLRIAMEDRLMALTLESGQELWSVPLSTASVKNRIIAGMTPGSPIVEDRSSKVPPIRLCVRDQFVAAFDPLAGITLIDAQVGKVLWTFVPPRGKLQRQWSCGDRQIVLQTLQPSITWVLDLAAERQVTDYPGSTEPWLWGPEVDDAESLVTVNTDRSIESKVTQSGRTRWVYQGGMSFAHVDPYLWSAGSRILLTVDGLTLAGVNRATGHADWSVGIAGRPFLNPARQVIATDDSAFAASQGLLRRISLRYGTCEWEQFLGSATEQWRVAAVHDTVAAWPADSVESHQQKASFVVWCDTNDGRILQRLNLPKGERVVDAIGDEQGWLVQTNQNLIAFRSSGERQVVATSGKP
jgi:outer membrane protein assembly factor BamB/tetratricopeptide (TPR) repeat protein